MRVLLTGANGFIGSQLTVGLLAAGYEVVAVVRDPGKFVRRFPNVRALKSDLNYWTTPEHWQDALAGVDAVVNCAGALHERKGQNLNAIHALGPIALFKAASANDVKKVIQISAVSTGADTEYARTKETADIFLQNSSANWTILKPSIVYGHAAYGGTAMLRALAACPFRIPVIGDGQQTATPIHVNDLVEVVLLALQTQKLSRQIVIPCGPETITLSEMTKRYRLWLGLSEVPFFHIPIWLLRLFALVGDRFGSGPITTTSLKQLEHGNIADSRRFSEVTGLSPRSFSKALQMEPASTAELWHARFYLLKPAIRTALIFLWGLSGMVGLLASPQIIIPYFKVLELTPSMAATIGHLASVMDLVIAAILLVGRWPKIIFYVQVTVVIAYTVFLTAVSPSLWLDLFGSLLKNIPILALIMCQRILDEER